MSFSGGLSSFEAARRTIERHGHERTVLVFADVKGDPERDPHASKDGHDGESPDTYRFLEDAERLLGQRIERVRHPDGLSVWGAIFRRRAINMQGAAPCTKLLKSEVLAAFRSRYPDAISVTGLNWDEDDRRERSLRFDPRQWFPLAEAPYVNNRAIIKYLRERGVEPPVAYTLGFSHNNCNQACIKAGQAQWGKLLRLDRARYLYNEEQEELFRAEISPNVAILKERRDGVMYPLPLRVFRERLEQQGGLFDTTDWGGCGCGVLSALEAVPA